MKRPEKAPQEGRERDSRSLFARLAQDVKGNTLAMVGAALLPLTAMIGSGVDMSRAYMAKTRLQAACDAGALAGRRVMSADTLSQNVIDEAKRFFNFNFPQGKYETAAFTPEVTRPSTGVVQVEASTTIPTVVMKIFGFDTLPLNVECDASLNFVNTDIVLVLDVTGSMDWDAAGNTTTVVANKRITGLKAAVMALYDALAPVQAQLEANGLRLRYGIVPYSTTVNVGGLIRAVNPNYLADDADYQSRSYRFATPTYVGTPGTPTAPVVEVFGSSISSANCDKYGRNVNFSGFTKTVASGGGPAPSPTWTKAFSNDEASGVDWGWSGAPDTSGTTKSCRRRWTQTTTTYVTEYSFTEATYVEESIDVSEFKLGNPVTIANNVSSPSGTVEEETNYDFKELAELGTGVATTSYTWNGCIVERETVDTINALSGYSVPSAAHDLNINLIPTADPATQWKPMWPAVTFRRSAGVTSSATATSMATNAPCPAAARRLANWDRASLQTYVNGLVPTGNTYHDIGMIWGARMISTGGIFADACENFNGMPCTRHVIFMTDGEMAPVDDVYQAYGIEQNDKRITGTYYHANDAVMKAAHTQRFKMACNASKAMGTSIWVIAFGTGLNADLTSCASNANQASAATSSAALIAKFTEIGNNIGALRLTQ